MASICFVLCLCEVVIVWGSVAVLHSLGPESAHFKLVTDIWLLSGAASVLSATGAIIFDSRRNVGIQSLIVAVAVFMACALPMLV
jgi:hypothetical protein